jgi:predicted dehydrogenase
MKFSNGVTAQISSGFRTPFREGTHFVGDKGVLQLPEPWKPGLFGSDSYIHFHNQDDKKETLAVPKSNPYSAEVAAMEACILDGAEPVVPLSLSRDCLRSVLALYESAETGQVVKL